MSSQANETELELKLKKLLGDLSNKDGLVRQRAREELVEIGRPAIDYLMELRNSPKHWLRWEAVKTLSEMNDPLTAPILVNTLQDENDDVRWLAAEGIIELEKDGLQPLFQNLITNYESVFLCEGAHHILKELVKRNKYVDSEDLIPKLANRETNEQIPLAAKAAFDRLVLNA